MRPIAIGRKNYLFLGFRERRQISYYLLLTHRDLQGEQRKPAKLADLCSGQLSVILIPCSSSKNVRLGSGVLFLDTLDLRKYITVTV